MKFRYLDEWCLAEPTTLLQVNDLIDISFNRKWIKPVHHNDLHEVVFSKNSWVYTCWDGDRLAALMVMVKVKTLTHSYMTYENIIVHPDYRRQGIGHAFDKEIIRKSKEEDCDSIEFVVPTDGVGVQIQHLKNGIPFRQKLPMGIILKHWTPKS